MRTEPVLVAETIACVRGGRRVFAGVSFALARGGAVQVEGANGAGKSSLLRVLGGLLAPAAGTLNNPFGVAWCGAGETLKAGRTLRSELGYWARLDGAGAAAVDDSLAAFDLAGLAELPVDVLSSGQRRRAALARVHASAADLWLLDEPGVGLDTASLARLADAIRAHRARGGLVVAATHAGLGIDAPQVLRLGDSTSAAQQAAC